MEKKKYKGIFINGSITHEFINKSISKHSSKTGIGGHNIFLGQVRADVIKGKEVKAIEYYAYEEMAEKKAHEIREVAFNKFDLICLHIYHSLGIVKTGEICFYVFVSSAHRDACYKASRFIVEEVKKTVPIFGKELFDDNSFAWKRNKD